MMPHSQKQNVPIAGYRPRAFTLIELLVVIGIITILISLVLGALSASRKKAMEVVCTSNLRQLGIAMTFYTTAHRYYPGAQHFEGFSNDRSFAVWPTRLRNAMLGASRSFEGTTQGIFSCPANDSAEPWESTTGVGSAYANPSDEGYGYQRGEKLLQIDRTRFAYGYNDWGAGPNGAGDADQTGLGGDLVTPPGANKYGRELQINRVKRPSEMIAITDSSTKSDFTFSIDPREPDQWPGAQHRGGANVLFCDGHVDWYKQSRLVDVDPASPDGAAMNRMWNNDNVVHERVVPPKNL